MQSSRKNIIKFGIIGLVALILLALGIMFVVNALTADDKPASQTTTAQQAERERQEKQEQEAKAADEPANATESTQRLPATTPDSAEAPAPNQPALSGANEELPNTGPGDVIVPAALIALVSSVLYYRYTVRVHNNN